MAKDVENYLELKLALILKKLNMKSVLPEDMGYTENRFFVIFI